MVRGEQVAWSKVFSYKSSYTCYWSLGKTSSISDGLHSLFLLLGTIISRSSQRAYITRKAFPKQTLSSVKTSDVIPRSWCTRLEISSLDTRDALQSLLYFIAAILLLLHARISQSCRSFSLPRVTRMFSTEISITSPGLLGRKFHFLYFFLLSCWKLFSEFEVLGFLGSICLCHPKPCI